MLKQIELNFSEAARDAGIQKALDSAERNVEGWGDIAYNFLKRYLQAIPATEIFMLEDVRSKSEGIVPEPTSKRAWGAIVVRAKKENLIVSKGIKKVINPKAHRCFASAWSKAA